MNFSWKIDEKSIREIQESLKGFERKVRNKIIRQGARDWANDTTGVIKSNITWNDKVLKKYVTSKIKTLKRGRGIWVGVGIRSGVRVGQGIDSHWAGTKARWYNDGWTAYPKGRKSGRTGKDWRLGLRGVGGTKVYQTNFITNAGELMLPRLPQYIVNSIQSAIQEQGR
jgi:hypothetical protein